MVVPSNGISGNENKLEYRKFCKNMIKNLLIMMVTEHWNRLRREVVESPTPGIFKTRLATYLCDRLYGTCFSRELDSVIFRGPFQPLRFCDSV